MRFMEHAKVYNTETGLLLKLNVTKEELEDGWTVYVTRGIYLKEKGGGYWMHVRKVAVDRHARVVDKQDYAYAVDEEFVKSFNKRTETP